MLSVLVNALLVMLASCALYLLENSWQARVDRENREIKQELYFNKAERYLERVTSNLSTVITNYSGLCSREFVIDMRRKLFNIPGAIEFGIVETVNEKGMIVCSSWGEGLNTVVRKPELSDGFLITGPHKINSLDVPVYVIKKTVDDVEFNILIKQDSVDDFIANNPEISITINNRILGEKYRDSNFVTHLSYVIPKVKEEKIHNGYFVLGSFLMLVIFYFLVTPRIVKLIERYILRFKIKNHYYYNEYQAIFHSENDEVFSIEVFLRSKYDTNIQESLDKIKHLNLNVDHTVFQINQIELNFDDDFIQKNSFQINISSLHLEDEEFIAKMISFAPSLRNRLILEVVEDEDLMEHKDVIKKHMTLLKGKGYRFAIDDFGTLYASLSYVSEFDFDIVKIDKLFIENNTKNNAILKAIISLTNEIGIGCIAEGIETEEDKEKMNSLGIHLHQGWYYCRSMSAEEITHYTVS
ncbi:hypothetical protein MUS1_01810 [Marinomonas ushuaiensis DSM 15871]|uniref:EAL domain-containing protein n=2 Tax=Marinomonas TaxID=28253 RepID=X7E9A7_9GAMM|nr:hypothetical protein MUS1_01810 [Marinomonas ushuaiensis DSM 15871]